jgi:hypothetical protein
LRLALPWLPSLHRFQVTSSARGISAFDLPIRYSEGGSMTASMGAVAATMARGESASDRGKWWVSGSQLCQRWSSWMKGKTYCYKLTRRGNSVTWVRNDGRSGSARIG